MELPTGTVTFLFTDIEGSTRLLQELGENYRELQDDHTRLLREAISAGGGTEVRTEGDSFFAVFPTAGGAVQAAVAAQRALHAHRWSHGRPLRVRMGMHTGEGRRGGDDYLGIDVNRAARIAAAGHGGQVLVSGVTRSLVEHDLPEGVSPRGSRGAPPQEPGPSRAPVRVGDQEPPVGVPATLRWNQRCGPPAPG